MPSGGAGQTGAIAAQRSGRLKPIHNVPPPQIAQTLSCGIVTVYNVKRRYLAEGLEAALAGAPWVISCFPEDGRDLEALLAAGPRPR